MRRGSGLITRGTVSAERHDATAAGLAKESGTPAAAGWAGIFLTLAGLWAKRWQTGILIDKHFIELRPRPTTFLPEGGLTGQSGAETGLLMFDRLRVLFIHSVDYTEIACDFCIIRPTLC